LSCLMAIGAKPFYGSSFSAPINIFFTSNYKTAKIIRLAAIAEKALKEVTYHVRWSSEWVIRLGDGTEESRQRMLHAVNELWSYTGELFMPADYELPASQNGNGIELSSIKNKWTEKVTAVFEEATLPLPPAETWMQSGGKQGKHSEHLGFILAEMQFLQRAYPNATW
jgi:ring-1,2-phenylacetyl-CoA epoxidase subunit PaaC